MKKWSSPFLWLWIAVFAFSLALRLFFVLQSPYICCWDAFARLWEPETLFVRFWLPLPQLGVFLVNALGGGLLELQLFYILSSVLGALFFGIFAAKWAGDAAGLAVFALVSLLPDFVNFSTAPYQEGTLLLCLGAFLYFWCKHERSFSKKELFLSMLFLALAMLCRYEAWVLAMLVLAGVSWRREWRRLSAFALPLLTAALWLFTSGLRTSVQGPPRLIANPLKAQLPENSLQDLLLSFLESASWTAEAYAGVLSYLGVLLVAAGIIFSWKRQLLLHKELVIFFLFLVSLTALRAHHASVLNTSMMLTLFCFSLPYLVLGAQEMLRYLKDRLQKPVLLGLIVGFLCSFIMTNIEKTPTFLRKFEPEARAATLLEFVARSSSPSTQVLIKPRYLPNVLQESTVGAIFAHSNNLCPNDPQWVFPGKALKPSKENARYLLYYQKSSNKYSLSNIN